MKNLLDDRCVAMRNCVFYQEPIRECDGRWDEYSDGKTTVSLLRRL